MGLLVLSLCLNVYLGWKVKHPSVPGNTAKLSPGMKVDPVTALGQDGKPLTISYNGSDKPTVFYVITPSCIWCRRNQANINKVADTEVNDFRFIGLSLAEPGLKEYLAKHHLEFPVYAGVTTETIKSLGLGSTPQTIVVSPDGKVLRVWMGAYVDEIRPEVEAYFGIQLPGLTSVIE
jgi:peroxiredoxin